MASEELSFKLSLILIHLNLNIHMTLMVTMLDSIALYN